MKTNPKKQTNQTEETSVSFANVSVKSEIAASSGWEDLKKWWNTDDFLSGSDSSGDKNSTESVSTSVPEDDVAFRASTWFSDYEAMKRTVHLYNEIHPFIYGFKGREANTGDLYSLWGSAPKTRPGCRTTFFESEGENHSYYFPMGE